MEEQSFYRGKGWRRQPEVTHVDGYNPDECVSRMSDGEFHNLASLREKFLDAVKHEMLADRIRAQGLGVIW